MSVSGEARRALYASRKAQGLCVRCGKEPAIEGKSYGEFCLVWYREYHRGRKDMENSHRREAYKILKASHVCPKCKRNIVPGKVLCEVCLQKAAVSRGKKHD
jgi:hypothetical protein